VTRRIRSAVDLWVDCFNRHQLLDHASAIALRGLVALIPLTLLGLALLGAFGLEDVWRQQLAPPLKHHLTHATYRAINAGALKIFHQQSAGLIAFAGLLAIWNVSSMVRASMTGLDAIYEQEETRSTWHRFALSIGLGIGITLCIVGSMLAVTAGRHIGGSDGFVDALLLIVRWAVAIALLGVAVGLLVHFAPTKRRAERWVGLGTMFVVAVWIAMTLVFSWFVSSVANFKTAPGQLAVFLVLTTFGYLSANIFLIGVQADELMRKGSRRRGGLLSGVRAVTGG
jgi:YihY family inner membrane protein